MLTKILVAVIAMLAGWILMRYLSQPRGQNPARAEGPKPDQPADKVTTLERDPKTGIYR
jgi:hypothetical protein